MSKKDRNISWRINQPLSDLQIYDGKTADYVTDKKEIDAYLNQTVPIKSGDKVVVLYVDGLPAITVPVTGTKLINVLRAIEKGVNQVITDSDFNNTMIVYKTIGNFFHKKDRLNLVNKFESKKLKVKDLLGDHIFYEGGLHRKNHVWLYGLGS